MFYLGLDLGQRKDHSAIAIIERSDRAYAFHHLEVCHLERLPLGTAYTAVVNKIAQLVNDPRLANQITTVVDATGVGAPVVDLLRNSRLGCPIVPVCITGGEKATLNGSTWNVPKKDLIGGLEVLLGNGELRIAKRMREAFPLTKEMTNIRRATLSAEGPNQHDDLVIAVALATWKAKQKTIGLSPNRIPGI